MFNKIVSALAGVACIFGIMTPMAIMLVGLGFYDQSDLEMRILLSLGIPVWYVAHFFVVRYVAKNRFDLPATESSPEMAQSRVKFIRLMMIGGGLLGCFFLMLNCCWLALIVHVLEIVFLTILDTKKESKSSEVSEEPENSRSVKRKKSLSYSDILLSVAIGDIVGSQYELPGHGTRWYSRVRLIRPGNTYTDDTVCTFAIAKAVDEIHRDRLYSNADKCVDVYRRHLWECCNQELQCGYGTKFREWLGNPDKPTMHSYGNGATMRIMPAILHWIEETEDDCIEMVCQTAAPTHDHPESYRGIRALTKTFYRLAYGYDREATVNGVLAEEYPDWCGKSYRSLHRHVQFDCTCQGTVPLALICFRDSWSFEDCLKKCIATQSDADTLCAMAAPLAAVWFHSVPEDLKEMATDILPRWMLDLCMYGNSSLEYPLHQHFKSSTLVQALRDPHRIAVGCGDYVFDICLYRISRDTFESSTLSDYEYGNLMPSRVEYGHWEDIELPPMLADWANYPRQFVEGVGREKRVIRASLQDATDADIQSFRKRVASKFLGCTVTCIHNPRNRTLKIRVKVPSDE